jgi:hypothetical protein
MSDEAAPTPAPDDAKEEKVIELRVVRHRAPGGGRPLFLNDRRFLAICQWIESGESIVESCRREFVTYAGFRKHVTRKPQYARRLKQAELVREGVLREFHIANVKKQAEKNLLASLWWLERTDPGHYALRRVDRTDSESGEKLIGTEIPMDRVLFYGKLMREVDRENEQHPIKSVELPDAESA